MEDIRTGSWATTVAKIEKASEMKPRCIVTTTRLGAEDIDEGARERREVSVCLNKLDGWCFIFHKAQALGTTDTMNGR